MNDVLCPVCEGQGCESCSYSGFMTESEYLELLVDINLAKGIE
jgi:hypothetical protein